MISLDLFLIIFVNGLYMSYLARALAAEHANADLQERVEALEAELRMFYSHYDFNM